MTRKSFLQLFVGSIAGLFATRAKAAKAIHPKPTHYTRIEGGEWRVWQWEGVHPSFLRETPAAMERINVAMKTNVVGELVYLYALRFANGTEWDIRVGWRAGYVAKFATASRPVFRTFGFSHLCK